MQLLGERLAGEASNYAPYVHNLPAGVGGVPIFYATPAMKALQQYPPVSAQVPTASPVVVVHSHCWRDRDAQKLCGSATDPAQVQVMRRCKWLVDFATTELAKAGGALAGVDANALGWAMACCSSRAFRTRGNNHPASLLPLIGTARLSYGDVRRLWVPSCQPGSLAAKKLNTFVPMHMQTCATTRSRPTPKCGRHQRAKLW